MTARVIDGRQVAARVREQVAAQAAAFEGSHGRRPGLCTILVGDDPASHTYVRMKRKACEETGIASYHHELPAGASQQEVVDLVQQAGEDDRVDGILVQLPLPRQVDTQAVIDAIPLAKDVDGLHPGNLGRMVSGLPALTACTPSGVVRLLDDAGVELSGANVTIVGRSNLVGKPLSLLLLARDATVTIAHSRTRDLAAVTRQADVLVSAVGRVGLVTADMVKAGAVVIDVGTNKVDGRLVGDVAFDEVAAVASQITPVPGGVGPMTIAMLLANTVTAASRRAGAAVPA